MRTKRPPFIARQSGFTLIELMVAMALGLMTTVIIAEVMLKSEGNRRTTTEGSDAQVSGALSLYAMQRDMTMAGFGVITSNAVLGCAVKGQYNGTGAVLHNLTLAPIKIDAAAAATDSDTITVLRSGGNGYAVPIATSATHGSADTAFTVQSSLGLQTGDIMLAAPAAPSATNWCTIFSVTSVPSTTSIAHAVTSNTWNPSTSVMPSSYASGSTLTKISQLVYRSYMVENSNLVAKDTVTDTDVASSNTVGTQIVLLKAYYGKDTHNTGAVDAYDTTTPTTSAGWQQVKTIRIALVARSGQREKDEVTSANPTWDVGKTVAPSNAVTCGSRKCVTLQVSPASGTDTEWKHYRYKVFDTVVPLRNMFWATSS